MRAGSEPPAGTGINEPVIGFSGETLHASDFTTNRYREIRQDAAAKKFGEPVPNLAIMPYNLEMTR